MPRPSLYSNCFTSHLSAFSKAVSLARLVKAEIVSPYSGILINTGVGNPTVPVGTSPLSKASPKRSWGGLLVFNLFIKRPRLDSFLSISIKSASHCEFQHPKLQIRALRTSDDVWFRPSRPVDAFLHYGRRHAKAKRCQVFNRRIFA